MTLSERRSAGIVHTKIDTLDDTDEEDEMKAAAAIEFQFAKGRGGWSKWDKIKMEYQVIRWQERGSTRPPKKRASRGDSIKTME
jgi:hypothetical protein